jgi:hypothetical protein
LLDAYGKACKTAEFADLARERLAEASNALPKDSPQLAGMLAQLGLSLLQQKKWTQAEPLLRECLAIREKAQSDMWSTFKTQSLLGGALLVEMGGKSGSPALFMIQERTYVIPGVG